jgi:heme A synthase
MRTVYRVLAYAIAAVVAIQAAAIGYAVFAQMHWIEGGGTLDKATFESSAPGTTALMFHALEGYAVFLVALALLIVSFFAKIPHGVRWAVIVLACAFVQIALGALSRMLAPIGALHGAVALVLFGVAVTAAMRVRKPAAVRDPTPAQVA